jgi:hypothetical protein
VPHKELDQPVLGGEAPVDRTAGILKTAGMGAGALTVLLGAFCLLNRRRGKNAAETCAGQAAEETKDCAGRNAGGKKRPEVPADNKEGGA